MKTIYKVLYPIGYEIHEVEVDFPTALPFVEVPPILFEKKEDETDEAFGRRQQSQFFNFTENKWEEVVTQDFSKKLELLEEIHRKTEQQLEQVQEENQAFKESNEALNNQVTDLQVAMTEIYESSLGGE